MIGVAIHASEAAAAAEFFELFKTEWEMYQPGRRYDIVLASARSPAPEGAAALSIRYQGRGDGGFSLLQAGSDRLPVYAGHVRCNADGDVVLTDEDGRCAGSFERCGGRWEARIGYDLFREIELLLTKGQPEEFAATPTVELHIELLRSLIRRSGQVCREVPPAPRGYRFLAALTHDVDHPSLRRHGLDHTALGFLFRASFGSFRDFCRGRLAWRQVWRNWQAAAKLPLVGLGWARDYWLDFVNYPELELGAPSTFFVLPAARTPGVTPSGEPAPRKRAAAYGAADIASELVKLRGRGCEIGLHGVDAWSDAEAGRRERRQVEEASRGSVRGARMHWLYWSEVAPKRLEQAGFDYDSTFGYNRTVGFRAGTAQPFRPLSVDSLIELPLIVMDTALFFPAHLNLSASAAWRRVSAVLDQVERFGGCLTVNWHDRSLFPERMWDTFYRELVMELRRRGAWITNASGAVRWFRLRREAFSPAVAEPDLPGLEIRTVHAAAGRNRDASKQYDPAAGIC